MNEVREGASCQHVQTVDMLFVRSCANLKCKESDLKAGCTLLSSVRQSSERHYVTGENICALSLNKTENLVPKAASFSLTFSILQIKSLSHQYNINIFNSLTVLTGTAVAQRLRHCATNRKVAGSIPAGAIGIFH